MDQFFRAPEGPGSIALVGLTNLSATRADAVEARILKPNCTHDAVDKKDFKSSIKEIHQTGNDMKNLTKKVIAITELRHARNPTTCIQIPWEFGSILLLATTPVLHKAPSALNPSGTKYVTSLILVGKEMYTVTVDQNGLVGESSSFPVDFYAHRRQLGHDVAVEDFGADTIFEEYGENENRFEEDKRKLIANLLERIAIDEINYCAAIGEFKVAAICPAQERIFSDLSRESFVCALVELGGKVFTVYVCSDIGMDQIRSEMPYHFEYNPAAKSAYGSDLERYEQDLDYLIAFLGQGVGFNSHPFYFDDYE